MSRKKRTSSILEKAELRMAGLKEINPVMDFGDARSLQTLSQQMERLRNRLEAYNGALSVIDSAKSEIEELEKSLGDLTEKMLIGVAFKYGKDSREYEMAGGVRKSERIRRSSVSRLKASTGKPSGESSQTAQSNRIDDFNGDRFYQLRRAIASRVC